MSDDELRKEVFDALHKVTVDDDVLDQKGDNATLDDDLELGTNDFIWLAGRLSFLSHGHGGSALFQTEIGTCKNVEALVKLYIQRATGRGAIQRATTAKRAPTSSSRNR